MDRDEKKRVIVALSGGVDSSVAAHLLKKQGYAVTGLYLRLFNDAKKEKQVGKIAKNIGIQLVIKDARQEFKKKVIDYFIREYESGRTPNPCVVCNREIKFKFLFQELKKLKANYIATGHYARKCEVKCQMSNVKCYGLFEAKDKTKDQSYFLYTLSQKQLARILFPLGKYKKTKIIKLASVLRILHTSSIEAVCRHKESQNVCFISEKNPDLFLKKNIKAKSGDIIDTDGNILGRHEGLFLYTLGQRRGIKIGGRGPYYVAGKNFRKNTLLVTNNSKDRRLLKNAAFLKSINWISNKPKLPAEILVRNRYHDPLSRAIIDMRDGRYRIRYSDPQRAVTPGQSAVFYTESGEVSGGGIIAKL